MCNFKHNSQQRTYEFASRNSQYRTTGVKVKVELITEVFLVKENQLMLKGVVINFYCAH
jgi:hypothetical protein